MSEFIRDPEARVSLSVDKFIDTILLPAASRCIGGDDFSDDFHGGIERTNLSYLDDGSVTEQSFSVSKEEYEHHDDIFFNISLTLSESSHFGSLPAAQQRFLARETAVSYGEEDELAQMLCDEELASDIAVVATTNWSYSISRENGMQKHVHINYDVDEMQVYEVDATCRGDNWAEKIETVDDFLAMEKIYDETAEATPEDISNMIGILGEMGLVRPKNIKRFYA